MDSLRSIAEGMEHVQGRENDGYHWEVALGGDDYNAHWRCVCGKTGKGTIATHLDKELGIKKHRSELCPKCRLLALCDEAEKKNGETNASHSDIPRLG